MEVEQVSSEEFIDVQDDVFMFDKSLLDRLVEIKSILFLDKKLPAAEVSKEWSHFLEVAMEPAGWQAIWQISRCICDKLNLRFPTKVMGTIEQVFFTEQTAMFCIEAVQEDSVEMPEKFEVPLIELWPLKKQENPALCIELTAKALDQFRFFYNHIWFPWDSETEDDIDWPRKNVESRMKFHLVLVANKMKPALVSYVRHLLAEAQYIQGMKEQLEVDLEDGKNTEKVKELMRLNFRLNRISNEVETIENPVLREYFEKMKFENFTKEPNVKSRYSLGHEKPSILAICSVRPLSKLTKSFQEIEKVVGADCEIGIKTSLQDLLDTCSSMDKVFLLPGKHGLTFSEYIFGRGEFLAAENGAIIAAKYSENALFTIHGDFTFENLTFNCENVRNGVIIKGGRVIFRNCTFESASENVAGVAICENSEGIFENCNFHNFSSAISTSSGGLCEVKMSEIHNSFIGINASSNSVVLCDKVKFVSCKEAGIFMEILTESPERNIESPSNDEMQKIEQFLQVKDSIFEGKNVVLSYKKSVEVFSQDSNEDRIKD